MPLLFTPASARRLRITRRQVYRLMKAGELRYVVIGRGRTGVVRTRHISRVDLEDYTERATW